MAQPPLDPNDPSILIAVWVTSIMMGEAVEKRGRHFRNACAAEGFAHFCVPTFTLIGKFSSIRRACSNDTVRSFCSSTPV